MPEDAEIGDRVQMGMTGSLCQQFRAPAAVAPARPSPAGLFFARLLSSTLMPKQPGLDPNAEREAYVAKRARELATSGRYYSWRDIEVALRFEEDLPGARQWLDNPSIRDELDRLCEHARQEPAGQ